MKFIKKIFTSDLEMLKGYKQIKLLLALFLIFWVHLPAFALQQSVNLPKIDESLKDGLLLKNYKAFREIYFTKPKTWQVLAGSSFVLKFNHSSELIPARSHLKVFINGKLVKVESLDSSSLDTKTLNIPLPVASLMDGNTIRLEVEQHYTDVCEDPLDHSLWTSIKKDSFLNFNYNQIAPKVDLAVYPFPFFDPFAYAPSEVNFVVPSSHEELGKSLNALGLIVADISQKISWHDFKYKVQNANTPIDKSTNTVIVGTPYDNPAVVKVIGSFAKNIGGIYKIVDKSGAELDSSKGLIYLNRNKENSNRVVLVITANSSEGITNAAKYLTNDITAKDLKGNSFIVNGYNPSQDLSSKVAPYIYNQSLSFEKLGFKDKKAERIGPPPLEYPIRIMPTMSTTKEMLSANLIYSYGPGINPELSSMEVKFNGISLKGISLTNTDGEENKSLNVQIPYQYVKPYNKLEVYFHLFPSKYGYCKGFYKDNFWGKISKDSYINLPSDAKIMLPNISLFNDVMFPYTTAQDLSNTAIVISSKASLNEYQALVNIIGSIAKLTSSEAGINLLTSVDSEFEKNEMNNRNVILIGTIADNSVISDMKDRLFIIFDQYFKKFQPKSSRSAEITYDDNQGIIEQINSEAGKVITVFYAKTDNAVKMATELVSNKDNLVKLSDGYMYVNSSVGFKPVLIVQEEAKAKTDAEEEKLTEPVNNKKIDENASNPLNIAKFDTSKMFGSIPYICVGIAILLLAIFLIRVIVGALFARKE